MGPNVTGRRSVTHSPTKGSGAERSAATAGCNDCNEALDVLRAALTDSRRLALIAENALANGGLHRAREVIRRLHNATEDAGDEMPPLPFIQRRRGSPG